MGLLIRNIKLCMKVHTSTLGEMFIVFIIYNITFLKITLHTRI